MMTNYDYVVWAMQNAKDDSLERAQNAFRHKTQKEMKEQYGRSGQTCAEILADYQKGRKMWQEAMDWLDKLKDRL